MTPPPPLSGSRLLPGCLRMLTVHSLIRVAQPAGLSPAWLIAITTRQREHADARSWCVYRQLWKTCWGTWRVNGIVVKCVGFGWSRNTGRHRLHGCNVFSMCTLVSHLSSENQFPRTELPSGTSVLWGFNRQARNRVWKTIWVNFCTTLNLSEFTNK